MIREATPEDFTAILALNQESVQYLSPLNRERLAHLHGQAAYHKIIEVDRLVAAFLLAFRRGADYDSPNYAWFSRRSTSFCYIDRAVVHKEHRKKGYAAFLYEDLIRFASATGVATLTCEIDIEPPNQASLLFHESHGFCEVGTQWINGGKKQVSLREKALL